VLVFEIVEQTATKIPSSDDQQTPYQLSPVVVKTRVVHSIPLTDVEMILGLLEFGAIEVATNIPRSDDQHIEVYCEESTELYSCHVMPSEDTATQPIDFTT
jgi:hypothetical protein